MKRNEMSKLSASLFVLMLTLSAVGTFPMAGQAQLPTYKNIYIPVGSSEGAVTDAWVNLTDVHTGNVIAAQYSSQSNTYVVSNAPSAYYRVDVVNPNYFDAPDAAEFAFDGFDNYTVSPIYLQGFPIKSTTWNVTVTDSDGNPISGAVIGFYYQNNLTMPIYGEFVARATTDISGNAVFKMFKTTINFYFVIMKPTYATYYESFMVTGDGWRNITLSPSHRVTGFAADASGPANNVVAYLINTNSSTPWFARVLKSYGSFVAFDAYDGTFTLVVDAKGDSSNVTAVTVSGSNVALTIPQLASQTQRTEYVNLTYGANFNSFSLSVATHWSYDDAYPGLQFNDMGSLRTQVDLVMGNGDGILTSSEINQFVSKVQGFGSQYISSFALLETNDTAYASGAIASLDLTFVSGQGPVTLQDEVNYSYTCLYTSHSPIYNGADAYTGSFVAHYDSSSVNYSYRIALVNNYELIMNSSTTRVVVTGYVDIIVEPTLVATGGQETVSMTFETSVRPIAKASIITLGSAYAYPVNESGNVTRYIVAVGHEVTFSSQESQDPNGNPLTYRWDFGDGSPVNITMAATIVHNYTANASVVANLTVTDVVGLVNWSDINVTCDGTPPTPVISVLDKVINTTDDSVAVDQREAVYFNATSSVDDAVSAGDHLGVIDHVQFVWGDGNISAQIAWTAEQQNVSHAYELSGHYNLTLTATDVVGNWMNATLRVDVNDTQAPSISYVVKNASYGTTLIENSTLIFDANTTTDNVDTINQLTFSWEFGDGNWLNLTGAEGGANVTHNYSRTGSITVRLNVTDLSNNSNVKALIITVASGPRPNVLIDNITYEPSDAFTQGSAGKIIVNMTNKGSANATDIVVTFYIVQADGKQKLIGTSRNVTLDGTPVTIVKVGESVQVEFSFTPRNKGTYTIRVNVTSHDQLRPDSKNAPELKVKQSALMQIALWAGVAAIIILIPLLLYLRGRWAKREKKGPRRERKEKGGGEEEE